jgi:nitrogen fixation protein FixH
MDRLERRIHQLELGEEIAAKDIKALLTAEQHQQLVDALAAQVALKKNKRARTGAEKQALGWKSIREVRLDVLRSALNAANDDLLADYQRRLREKEVRQANIYLREYSEARKADKSVFSAQGAANNALTRAARPRVDGQAVRSLSKRDKEVFEMEEELKRRIRSEMTAEELEQLDMLEGVERHEKTPRKARK